MDNKLSRFYNSRLRQIFLYITYECNFSCKHCLLGDRANLAFYSREEVFNILKIIRANGGSKVTFLGGEPTLHPDFFEIVSFARELGFFIVLDTNGSFPDHFWQDARINHIDTFCFSVDGHNSNIHEKTRQHGSFDRLLKQVASAQRRQQKIKFTHTVTKSNIDYVVEMINFARQLEIDELNIHVATYNGRAKTVLDPDIVGAERWYSTYRSIRKFVANQTFNKLVLRIPPRYCTRDELRNEFSDHQCFACLADRMLILPKANSKNDLGGPLYVCGLLIGEKHKIGWNINNHLVFNSGTDSEYERYYRGIPHVDNIPICPIISQDSKNLNYLEKQDLFPLCISYKPLLASNGQMQSAKETR